MQNQFRRNIRITENPDIAFLMQMLRQMSDVERDAVLEQVSKQMEAVFEANSQEGMIRQFRQARAHFTSLERTPGHIVSLSHGYDTKPSRSSPRIETLHPLLVKDLSVGDTHRGRYLCGSVAVEDAFSTGTSASFLLQDISGQLVSVAVYNIDDISTPKASNMFPKGRHFAIVEPFFKTRSDMTNGIRIDDPREIVEWHLPVDCREWKELGNRFMHSRPPNPDGAMVCYDASLEQVSESFLNAKAELAILLTNIAICKRKSEEFALAARYAGIASCINSSNDKAHYVLAASLFELGRASSIRDACLTASFIVESRGPSSNTEEIKTAFRGLAAAIRAEKRSPKCTGIENDRESGWIKAFSGDSAWCLIPGILEWADLDGRSETEKKSMVASQDARFRGSAFFREGKVKEAETLYYQAIFNSKHLISVVNDMAIIMSNRAAALLMKESLGCALEGDLKKALIDGCVSALLNRNNWKPWVRQTRVIEKAMDTKDALQYARRILRCIEQSNDDEDIADSRKVAEFLSTEITRLEGQSAAGTATPPSKNYTEDQLKKLSAASRPSRRLIGQEGGIFDEMESIDDYIQRQEHFTLLLRSQIASGSSRNGRTVKSMCGPLCTRQCPKIHIEFPKSQGWPGGIDIDLAKKMLYRGYLDAQLHPWVDVMMMREGIFYFTPNQVFRRWGGSLALQEICQRRQVIPGDIIDCRAVRRELGGTYGANIRSNFANNPTGTHVLLFGGTHVAIGFNDLGCLLSAEFRASKDFEKHEGPLRFIGFERSEFSIAKFSVIAYMLKDRTVPLGHIIQIWYSSTWSCRAFQSFRRSVASVVRSRVEASSDFERKVTSYLEYWAEAEPISLALARKRWLDVKQRKNNRDHLSDTCSYHRKRDRMALCNYFLTGDLLLSEMASRMLEESYTRIEVELLLQSNETDKPLQRRKRKKKAVNLGNKKKKNIAREDSFVGSVTMWNVPPGSPALEDDNMFNTVTLDEILLEHTRNDPETSIVDLFVQRIMKKLGDLRQHVLNNRITIEIRHGIVKSLHEEGGLEMVSEILSLEPDSMSWSNVLDYMELEDFHEVARCCSSAGSTVHYGYSMNWYTELFGACIMDFQDQEENSTREVNRILDASLGVELTKRARESGMDRLLTVPFFDTPLNITSQYLCRRYYRKWTDHFANKAASSLERLGQKVSDNHRWPIVLTEGNSGWKFNNGVMMLENPVQRSSMTVYMTWSYDPSSDMSQSLQ